MKRSFPRPQSAGWLKIGFTVLTVSVMACSAMGWSASAAQPYQAYEYSSDNYNGLLWGNETANAVRAPSAYVAERVITGADLQTAAMSAPTDMCLGPDGCLYILDAGTGDSGNGRILVLEPDLKTLRCIVSGYTQDGQQKRFTDAGGLYVDVQRKIYVTMTESALILVLNPVTLTGGAAGYGDPSLIINAPDVGSLSSSFHFKPVKLVVDRAGRLYVVNQGSFEGLVELAPDGTFTGFVGANKVQYTLWELFWKQIATSKQLEGQTDFVPVEFSSVAVDGDGFLYTTARGDNGNQAVRRINLQGKDVLPRTEMPLIGELSPLREEGTRPGDSVFVDVALGDNGLFTCLDSVRGRLFTYDAYGNLLFTFGSLQNQDGAFKQPAAVTWWGDKLLVLDSGFAEITVFRPTEYGSAIVSASGYQFRGQYEQAWQQWEQVLKSNANSEAAYVGVGQALYRQGEYKQAADYFLNGNHRDMYSRAYKAYRKQVLAKWMPVLFVALGALLLAILVWQTVRWIKRMRASWASLRELAEKDRRRHHQSS